MSATEIDQIDNALGVETDIYDDWDRQRRSGSVVVVFLAIQPDTEPGPERPGRPGGTGIGSATASP